MNAILLTTLLRTLSSLRSLSPGEGGNDEGMSTAEYAIGTLAAAAFAALLYAVVTDDSVLSGLTALVQRAISPDF